MSETTRIFVKSLEQKGEKGPVIVQYQSKDGVTGTAKAWLDANLKQGEKYDVTFETKEGKYGEETWIKIPRSGGRGGFGGGGKADPAKLEIDKQRLNLEQQKQAKFDEKWEKDREAEGHRQASIQAQVIVKAAVDLAIAANKPEPAVVNGFALDLAETLRQTHHALYAAFATSPNGGGRQ